MRTRFRCASIEYESVAQRQRCASATDFPLRYRWRWTWRHWRNEKDAEVEDASDQAADEDDEAVATQFVGNNADSCSDDPRQGSCDAEDDGSLSRTQPQLLHVDG